MVGESYCPSLGPCHHPAQCSTKNLPTHWTRYPWGWISLRPAPALVVPCTSMPVGTGLTQMAAYQVCSHSASECFFDHVLNGIFPTVMTLGSQGKAVAS